MLHTIRYVYLAILAFILIARSKVTDWINKLLGKEKKVRVATWRVDGVYIFVDPPSTSWNMDYIEIPPDDIDFSDPDWKIGVSYRVPPSWPSWRIELVCTKKATTRRIVCRRDETMHFPGDVANVRNTRLFPRATVQEAIVRSGACRIDVTDQLSEYVMCNTRKFHPRDLVDVDASREDEYFLDVTVIMPNGFTRKESFSFNDPDANIVSLFTL
jgi:hypothetical protein